MVSTDKELFGLIQINLYLGGATMVVGAYSVMAAYSSAGSIGMAGEGGGCSRGSQRIVDEMVVPQAKAFTPKVFVSDNKLSVSGYM